MESNLENETPRKSNNVNIYQELDKYTQEIQEKYPKNIFAFTTISGSHSYGLETPESDIDFRGVYIGPVNNYIGLNSDQKNYASNTEEKDSQIFELRNFLNLALKANPNALELLFTKDIERIVVNENFAPLFENSFRWFISKRLKTTYLGYATSQFNKITGITTGKLGEARKHLVDKFGYDVKYASHAMRLLYTLNHYLTQNVFRTSPPIYKLEFLKSLKKGDITKKDFLYLYSEEIKDTEFYFAIYGKEIPDEPNYGAVEEFLMQILRKHVNEKL